MQPVALQKNGSSIEIEAHYMYFTFDIFGLTRITKKLEKTWEWNLSKQKQLLIGNLTEETLTVVFKKTDFEYQNDWGQLSFTGQFFKSSSG